MGRKNSKSSGSSAEIQSDSASGSLREESECTFFVYEAIMEDGTTVLSGCGHCIAKFQDALRAQAGAKRSDVREGLDRSAWSAFADMDKPQ